MRPTRLILPVAVIIGIVILSDEILFGSEKILLQNAKVPEDAKVSNAKKEQSLQNGKKPHLINHQISLFNNNAA